jgi:hypothetical protein
MPFEFTDVTAYWYVIPAVALASAWLVVVVAVGLSGIELSAPRRLLADNTAYGP